MEVAQRPIVNDFVSYLLAERQIDLQHFCFFSMISYGYSWRKEDRSDSQENTN